MGVGCVKKFILILSAMVNVLFIFAPFSSAPSFLYSLFPSITIPRLIYVPSPRETGPLQASFFSVPMRIRGVLLPVCMSSIPLETSAQSFSFISCFFPIPMRIRGVLLPACVSSLPLETSIFHLFLALTLFPCGFEELFPSESSYLPRIYYIHFFFRRLIYKLRPRVVRVSNLYIFSSSFMRASFLNKKRFFPFIHFFLNFAIISIPYSLRSRPFPTLFFVPPYPYYEKLILFLLYYAKLLLAAYLLLTLSRFSSLNRN